MRNEKLRSDEEGAGTLPSLQVYIPAPQQRISRFRLRYAPILVPGKNEAATRHSGFPEMWQLVHVAWRGSGVRIGPQGLSYQVYEKLYP